MTSTVRLSVKTLHPVPTACQSRRFRVAVGCRRAFVTVYRTTNVRTAGAAAGGNDHRMCHSPVASGANQKANDSGVPAPSSTDTARMSSNPLQGMSRYANESVPRSKLKVRRSATRTEPLASRSKVTALLARWYTFSCARTGGLATANTDKSARRRIETTTAPAPRGSMASPVSVPDPRAGAFEELSLRDVEPLGVWALLLPRVAEVPLDFPRCDRHRELRPREWPSDEEGLEEPDEPGLQVAGSGIEAEHDAGSRTRGLEDPAQAEDLRDVGVGIAGVADRVEQFLARVSRRHVHPQAYGPAANSRNRLPLERSGVRRRCGGENRQDLLLREIRRFGHPHRRCQGRAIRVSPACG